MKKSYWMGVATHTDGQKKAVMSWFSPVCDGMRLESAQVLCDVATDREKKVKAIMIDEDGKRQLVTRTLGKNYTITLAPPPLPARHRPRNPIRSEPHA